MAEQPKHFAVIFDPETGFQLLNTETNEVADLAVLEGTWRKLGESAESDVAGYAASTQQRPITPRGIPVQQASSFVEPAYAKKTTMLQYGGLRIRSMGAGPYAIADPRVSLRDDQTHTS